MNLEDHIGDIIRKARMIRGVSPAGAAAAAGLSEAELAALEDSGISSSPLNFSALAQALAVDAAKLETIAQGWLPTAKDLGQWRCLRVLTSAGEGMTVNAYLVWDEATRAAALFDTGFDAQLPLDTIAAEHLQLQHIFITHSHYDHVFALGPIRAAHPQALLHSSSPKALAAQQNQPGEVVRVGGLLVSHRATPGHAADGVTYVIRNWPQRAPEVAIVGDAIFAASMGRGNDSWAVARQKVREEILTLPPETLLCPGHGPLTTVAEEQAHNPLF